MLTCEFARYLEKMRRGRTWGDELTLRGICNSFGCHIHVVTSTEKNWYLEYEPDTVLTDKQVFLCVVESVPLLVCRMCSHTTLCTHRQAGMTHMYPPPHMTHMCSHTTLCTHRQAGMTHVSSSSYDTHVFSYDTGRTDKQIFLCFTSLSVTSSHHIIITHITVRTDKQVFLCYISPAHYNAISIAASQDGDGGAAEGGSGGGGSAVRATKRARGPERSRQDGGRGGGEGGRRRKMKLRSTRPRARLARERAPPRA